MAITIGGIPTEINLFLCTEAKYVKDKTTVAAATASQEKLSRKAAN